LGTRITTMTPFQIITKKTHEPQAVKAEKNIWSIQGYLTLLVCVLFPLFYGCSAPTIRLIDPSTKLMPCNVSIKDNRAEKAVFPMHTTMGTYYLNLGTDLESAFCNRIHKSQLPIFIERKNLSVHIEVDSLVTYIVDQGFTNLGDKCEIIGKVKFTNINGKKADKVIYAQHFLVTSKFNEPDGDQIDIECVNHFWEKTCTTMNITIDKFVNAVYEELAKEYQ